MFITKYIYPQRFEDFTSLLTSNKFMVFRAKEYKAFHPFNILLFLINILSVSLFIFILLQVFWKVNPLPPIITFVRIVTAYTSFILLKFGLEKIMANIFELDDFVDQYLFQKLTHRNFIALFLLPVTVLLFYGLQPNQTLLYVILGLILFSNIVSMTSIYKKNQNLFTHNWFYFILYLCALEIAPYIILYKLFIV